jgi:AcrR family transcriptional regulator
MRTNSREAIIQSARAMFAKHGFEKATIRLVAAEAGVDVALVMHYYGSKQQLFVDAMRPLIEIEVDDRIRVLSQAGDIEQLLDLWTGMIVNVLEDERFRQLFIGNLRAAATEPKAAEMMRTVFATRVTRVLEAFMPPEEAALRATFIGSTIAGLLTARHIIKVPPLTDVPAKQIGEYIRPVLRHYLTMPLK